jgi:hypothetical protein
VALVKMLSQCREACLRIESDLCLEALQLPFDALEPGSDVGGDFLAQEARAERHAPQETHEYA